MKCAEADPIENTPIALWLCYLSFGIFEFNKKIFTMKKNYFTKQCMAMLILVMPYFIQAQTWEDLGNPVVNGETVSVVHTIEGFENTVYLCTDKGLFASTDNGSNFDNLTWLNATTQNQPVRCVFRDANADLYIGTDTAVYKSTDSGNSWSSTALTAVAQVNDITKFGDNFVVGYGETNNNGGVYYSTDNLATATQSTTISQLQMLDFYFYNNVFYLAGKDAAYRSVDMGVNWEIAGTGHPSGGKYFTILEEGGNLFAGDVFGNGLYKSTDEGQTWANTDPATFTGFCQIFDITAANGYILAVVDGNDCNNGEPIKYSNDNGVSWNSAMFNITNSFYNELGRNASGSCLFVYSQSNKILYRTCDLTLAIEDKNTIGFAIYPNPTRDKLTIATKLPSTATLFGMDGKQLHSFTIVENRTTLELSDYPAGVYFLRFQTEMGRTVQRIVKQ